MTKRQREREEFKSYIRKLAADAEDLEARLIAVAGHGEYMRHLETVESLQVDARTRAELAAELTETFRLFHALTLLTTALRRQRRNPASRAHEVVATA